MLQDQQWLMINGISVLSHCPKTGQVQCLHQPTMVGTGLPYWHILIAKIPEYGIFEMVLAIQNFKKECRTAFWYFFGGYTFSLKCTFFHNVTQKTFHFMSQIHTYSIVEWIKLGQCLYMAILQHIDDFLVVGESMPTNLHLTFFKHMSAIFGWSPHRKSGNPEWAYLGKIKVHTLMCQDQCMLWLTDIMISW